MEKIKSVIKPSAQNRRWMSGIFSCPKNYDGVGGMKFLARCGLDDPRDGGQQE